MQAVLIRHLFALGFSFLLGIYLIPIIMRAAKKIGFMDAPDGHLKHQKEPVPYLGGVAIFLSFIMTLGLCYPFENQMLWLLLGTTLLLFIGLIDDLHVLKPKQKFFGQFIAVLCFLKGGFSLKTPFLSSLSNIFWSGFWMLTVINAFNLVDVMDGLCATLAILSALFFGVFAFAMQWYTTSLLLAAFIGAVGAFWVFNKPPAKIYLGDAGSLFIGGFLASIPLLFNWDRGLFLWKTGLVGYYLKPLFEVFFIPALVLAVPLAEVISLFIIRTWLGIGFYNGSPHHFSIYLQKKGWNRWQVLGFVAVASNLLFGFTVLFLWQIISFPLLAGLVGAWGGAWFWLVFF